MVSSEFSEKNKNTTFGGLTLKARRLCFAGLVGTTILAMIALMAATLSRGGISAIEGLLLFCFAVTLPWTVIGFWNAVIGLAILRLSNNPMEHVCPPLAGVREDDPIVASTAMLVCIRNEDTGTVFRNVSLMIEGLVRANVQDRFHVYILSDTDQAGVADAEEAAFSDLERRFGDLVGVHYRRRLDNPGYKAGNIRDFCNRWGREHDFALTLDADSYMATDAILRLVRLMQSDDRLGIAQSLVTGLPTSSAFARIFQFGMRHGMRSYTLGSAWWQGDCGPYWGHNALIRLQPFIDHCELPTLPGNPPLGGCILSHDQVEAVMMRRAGYSVRVVAEDEGSWEENPTSLPEFIRRDLRWCQGNMQYFPLLGLPGLHLVSRIQLLLAILMFLSAPAWIAFVVTVSTLYAFSDNPANMFWPGPGSAIFAIIMTMVFAPKFASLFDTMLRPALRRAYGGGVRMLISAVIELVLSMLIAPIMAVLQTLFLAGLPFGRKIGWPSQQRTSHTVPFGVAVKRLWVPTLFGAAALLFVFNGFNMATLFALPVFLGPLIAIPIAMITAWQPLGDLLVRFGLVPVPEEHTQPQAILALDLDVVGADDVEVVADPSGLQPIAQTSNT